MKTVHEHSHRPDIYRGDRRHDAGCAAQRRRFSAILKNLDRRPSLRTGRVGKRRLGRGGNNLEFLTL